MIGTEELVKKVMSTLDDKEIGYTVHERGNGYTVEQLCYECMLQIAKGNGQKHIQISCDDEGNGFHTLFYGFTSTKDYTKGDFHDDIKLKDNIILG